MATKRKTKTKKTKKTTIDEVITIQEEKITVEPVVQKPIEIKLTKQEIFKANIAKAIDIVKPANMAMYQFVLAEFNKLNTDSYSNIEIHDEIKRQLS